MQTVFILGSIFGTTSLVVSYLTWNWFNFQIKKLRKESIDREKRLKLDFSRRVKDLTSHIDLIYSKKEEDIKQINS